MKKLLSTETNNTTALLARLALGFVIFPHGAQNLLGGLVVMVLKERWAF
jgi:putative oxidoreductase